MKKKTFFWISALIILSTIISMGCMRSCNTIDLNQIFGIFNSNKGSGRSFFAKKDTRAPVIKLKGAESISIEQGTVWKEPGYRAIDNVDGNITRRVVIEGNVDTSVLGKYKITYNVRDRAGNEAMTKFRFVYVIKKNTNF